MDIFGTIGSLFGYVLWFFYTIVNNYGVSILLFAIFIKLILFPLSVKQQKSTAGMTALRSKEQALVKKYGNDKKKLEEERAKLYREQGVNPLSGGGCLTMIIPMLIMICVYYAVVNPLSNTLHLPTSEIDQLTVLVTKIPGIGVSFGGSYAEIGVVRSLDLLQNHLDFMNPDDLVKILGFKNGFNFLGLDLLGIPKVAGFQSMLWIIPVLCFATQVATQVVMQKLNGNAMGQQKGCMKYAIYLFPLLTTYFAYIAPAAVGFYWIASTVTGFIQTVILYEYYGPGITKAKMEAARVVLNEQKEKEIRKNA